MQQEDKVSVALRRKLMQRHAARKVPHAQAAAESEPTRLTPEDRAEDTVLAHDLGVRFDDIAALKKAKTMLEEAISMPLLVPEFFTGVRQPLGGVLLFGPPGTGKTMLAKVGFCVILCDESSRHQEAIDLSCVAQAVAGMHSSTFFNCSIPSLVSKFRGEGEKLVRTLFISAQQNAPSVIFIDEIDALLGARGNSDEHEASRRLKMCVSYRTCPDPLKMPEISGCCREIFTSMDGLLSDHSSMGCASVMVLAATNCPWHLDLAILRRLEKRIHIPMPNLLGRAEMFRLHLRDVETVEHLQVSTLARLTKNYSGSDIKNVCREAAMMPMRRMIANKSPPELQILRKSGELEKAPVTEEDFALAIANTKPSVSTVDLLRFHEFETEFGSS